MTLSHCPRVVTLCHHSKQFSPKIKTDSGLGVREFFYFRKLPKRCRCRTPRRQRQLATEFRTRKSAEQALSISMGTYKYRSLSLVSCRKSDSVGPREQKTQVNDELDIQEVASGRDAGCGSAISLVITITATIIGQHPPDHNMSDIYILSVRVGTAVVVLLCVSVNDVSRRSSMAS